WIILQRVFLIMGLLYFMRSITMFVTQVPVASTTYYCSPKVSPIFTFSFFTGLVAQLLSGFGLSINGQHTFCGDYIYSGHTVILTLAYLVVREYSPQRCKVVHITYLTLSCVGILMVLLSRGHYTVDVVIGYYVTTRLFWVYHTLANNQSLKNPSQNNYLARAWWFFIFSYFEKNVGAVVPRQYEWPLPWPRRLDKTTGCANRLWCESAEKRDCALLRLIEEEVWCGSYGDDHSDGRDSCCRCSAGVTPVQRQTWLLRNGGTQLGTRQRQCVCRGYDVSNVKTGEACGGGSGTPAVRRVTSLLLALAQTGETRAVVAEPAATAADRGPLPRPRQLGPSVATGGH
ncbi:hypothetical protein HPB47_011010, partial [Ixodes persulcatus]